MDYNTAVLIKEAVGRHLAKRLIGSSATGLVGRGKGRVAGRVMERSGRFAQGLQTGGQRARARISQLTPVSYTVRPPASRAILQSVGLRGAGRGTGRVGGRQMAVGSRQAQRMQQGMDDALLRKWQGARGGRIAPGVVPARRRALERVVGRPQARAVAPVSRGGRAAVETQAMTPAMRRRFTENFRKRTGPAAMRQMQNVAANPRAAIQDRLATVAV